ncbi:hypothetical protein Hanom_Chr10g00900341 [Helianthus anomalus]
MVNNLKKVVEVVKVEVKEEAVTKEQHVEEVVKVENVKIVEVEKLEEKVVEEDAEKKVESSIEVKDEILKVAADVGVDIDNVKKSDADQKQT